MKNYWLDDMEFYCMIKTPVLHEKILIPHIKEIVTTCCQAKSVKQDSEVLEHIIESCLQYIDTLEPTTHARWIVKQFIHFAVHYHHNRLKER